MRSDLLPAQGVSDHDATAARSSRGHTDTRLALHEKVRRKVGPDHRNNPNGYDEGAGELAVAGERAELENFIERSVILSRGPSLRAPVDELVATANETTLGSSLEEVAREYVLRVFRETGGVVKGVPDSAVGLAVERGIEKAKQKTAKQQDARKAEKSAQKKSKPLRLPKKRTVVHE